MCHNNFERFWKKNQGLIFFSKTSYFGKFLCSLDKRGSIFSVHILNVFQKLSNAKLYMMPGVGGRGSQIKSPEPQCTQQH